MPIQILVGESHGLNTLEHNTKSSCMSRLGKPDKAYL